MVLLLRKRRDVLIRVQGNNVSIQDRDLMIRLADLKSECLLLPCLCAQNRHLNIKVDVRTPTKKACEHNVTKAKSGSRPPWMNP